MFSTTHSGMLLNTPINYNLNLKATQLALLQTRVTYEYGCEMRSNTHEQQVKTASHKIHFGITRSLKSLDSFFFGGFFPAGRRWLIDKSICLGSRQSFVC